MEVYQSSKTAEELEYALGAVPSVGENGNWFIGAQDTGIFAGGVKVSGAEKGQTIVVKETDSEGKPTAWDAVDFPSGGEWICAHKTTLESDVSLFEVDGLSGNEFFIWTYARCNDADNSLTTGQASCMAYINQLVDNKRFAFPAFYVRQNDRFYQWIYGRVTGRRVSVNFHGMPTGNSYTHAFGMLTTSTMVEVTEEEVQKLYLKMLETNRFLKAGSVIEVYCR